MDKASPFAERGSVPDARSRRLLEEFEASSDAEALRSSLLQLPLATLLTGLYYRVDCFAGGDLTERTPLLPHLAMATIETLSFLGVLFARCPQDKVQRSSARAWRACFLKADRTGLRFDWLIAYAQFCDLMPKVHRGYYQVTGNAKEGFSLEVSEESAHFEERDIVLNELAQERMAHLPPPVGESDCRRLADAFPDFDADGLARMLMPYYEFELAALTEPFVVSAEGFEAAAGVTLEDYRRFRSAWAALAFVFQALHRHVIERIRHAPASKVDTLLEVYHGSHSVLLPREFTRRVLTQVCGLDAERWTMLVRFFAIDAAAGAHAFDHMGDTYFPPVLLIQDWLLFNPIALTIMMCARNLLFALNRLQPERFHATSHHSEPKLLQEAEDTLRQVPGLHLTRNVEWRAGKLAGEIDLLAYHAPEQIVLHIQAKGGLPAAGPRATRSREDRAREGLHQLASFHELSQADQNRILSGALGTSVRDLALIDVVLTRTNFGTARVWKQMGSAVALNIPLLRALMKENQRQGIWRLAKFRDDAESLMQRLLERAQPAWRPASMRLGKTLIHCTWLDFDDNILHEVTRDLWSTD
jgi:hypothetical protein